ncbi:MAG TPA: glycosyltransferase family 39 protein [bacterium]|nr:glycosyltransferase family 39 protein [bacterium]
MKHSFPLFLVLWMANGLLSYVPLSIGWKIGILLLGVLLPWLWAFRQRDLPVQAPAGKKDGFQPGWIAFALLGLLAVAARFSGLTTLLVWPNFDESSYGFDAFRLASGEAPRFLYGVSQAPPLFIWGLAAFFKLFGCSLPAFWAFPALVSLSAVPLAYLAARTFFPRPFAFLAAGLTALSFWPLFVGRFALMTGLVLPAELLAFYFLGRFLTALDAGARRKAAWGLGVAWGLGCYTHLHWPVVLAVTFPPFALHLWKGRRQRPSSSGQLLGAALLPALILALPLGIAAWRGHFGGYLAHLFVAHPGFSWSRQWAVWSSCLTSPFWGMDPAVHTYQPVWGGFLNPVLTSLFFLGCLRLARRRKEPLERWVIFGLLVSLLPGLLTQDQETFRLFPMVPFLILTCLMGLGILAQGFPAKRSLVLVLALAVPSLALDGHHLFGVFHRVWDDPPTWSSYTKSFGRYHAFGLLEEQRKAEGPGLIFPDFVGGLPDQSLAVATFDYNAVLNPRLQASQARWAAVLTNVNYQPFLKKRFPSGRAYALTRELPSGDGGWMLFLFPTQGVPAGTLRHWVEAQQALEPFLDRHLCYVMGNPMEGDIRALEKIEPAFQGDPYLRACYWEKLADVRVKGGTGGWTEAVQDLERAAREGYPAAHLLREGGVLEMLQGRPAEAKALFQKARRAPLDLTDAAQRLRDLGGAKTGGAAP